MLEVHLQLERMHCCQAVDKCKYLGIIIREANRDGDIKRQMRKCNANVNLLLRKFSYCSPDVKCYMFKSYCATRIIPSRPSIVRRSGLTVPLHR